MPTDMSQANRLQNLLKALGPGILWAGAAIGVSHLVQSTTAGAEYYFTLIWAIVVANLFKYPFFEFGPRYAAATGESLLDGYMKIGRWAVYVFFILTLGTMFAVQATVTSVTAALAEVTFGIELSTVQWSAILLVSCLIILAVGRFAALDKIIKLIIVVLAVLTIFAAVSAFFSPHRTQPETIINFDWFNKTHIFFLVALMGWMPCPLEISVWHSLWTVARAKQTGYQPTVKQALFDYKVGYYGTAFLAICFLTLGALLMYGKVENYAVDGATFAKQLIDLYVLSLGPWAKFIIVVAAFITMFSTTITCLDAMPRVLQRTFRILAKIDSEAGREGPTYWFSIIVLSLGSLFLISFYENQMRGLVMLATILSFLIAPIIAYLNYKLVTSKNMPTEFQPGKWLRILSWLGMLYLVGFGLWFLYFRFVAT